jgi:hypothetical protein
MNKLLFCALLLATFVKSHAADTANGEAGWTTPTTRVDGAQLLPEEIKGYVLRYQRNNETPVDLPMTKLQTLVVPDLKPGVYKFAVKLIDVNSLESDFSAIKVLTIVSKPLAPGLEVKIKY